MKKIKRGWMYHARTKDVDENSVPIIRGLPIGGTTIPNLVAKIVEGEDEMKRLEAEGWVYKPWLIAPQEKDRKEKPVVEEVAKEIVEEIREVPEPPKRRPGRPRKTTRK